MKGVIVAAGYGTRFLPVTKTVPKELLPVLARPSIDYVVEEFVGAGITEILVVTSRRKRALDDWFDREIELEAMFRAEGAQTKLDRIAQRPVKVQFVRQERPAGTGQALLLARSFAGGDPVCVAFPDDLFPDMAGELNATRQLVAVHERTGGSVLALADLVGQDVSRYGVVDAVTELGELRVKGIIEKPARGSEPSTLISLGRYLYTPDLFPRLEAGWQRHSGGEFYPMEALMGLAAAGRLYGRVLAGRRWDTGTPLGLLQASVEEALGDPALRDGLIATLRSLGV